MNIIFPALPYSKDICPFWEKESLAAKAAGFGISLVKDQNEPGSITISNKADSYLYRGWIVKPAYYRDMCEAAVAPLLNTYDHYMTSYDFPKWFAHLSSESPESIIFPAEEVMALGLEEIASRIKQCVGKHPLVVKDYLKSRKHEWYEACFIKDASDTEDTLRVLKNFFRLQGRDFYGGLVFREFLSLKKLGKHPKSEMPVPLEFRTFFLHNKPMITTKYWQNDIAYPDGIESPPEDWLSTIGEKLISPFVALDIAQTEDGKWYVIEVNDGGSAGYPEHLDSKEFYRLLFDRH